MEHQPQVMQPVALLKLALVAQDMEKVAMVLGAEQFGQGAVAADQLL